MLLILSSRMVSEEIALQFGALPPAMLPLGAGRLWERQIELAMGEPVWLTLPEDYAIGEFDRARLAEARVNILPLSASLSITEAIAAAIDHIAPEGAIRILYGDTLVSLPDDQLMLADRVCAKASLANYPWAFVRGIENGRPVFSNAPPRRLENRNAVCGYFHFADARLFAAICRENGFIDALNTYAERAPLQILEPETWLDFGHLSLYFQSKRDMLMARSFNDVQVEGDFLIKQSGQIAKMRDERRWFQDLPETLRLHTPRFGGSIERDHRAGYALEYLFAPSLADLFAFGELGLSSWLEIFEGCAQLLDKFDAIPPEPAAPEASAEYAALFHQEMIERKTRQRFDNFLTTAGLDRAQEFRINGKQLPSLGRVLDDFLQAVPPTQPAGIRLWHGDLFFGNMFYDFVARRALCIDPRGQLPGFGYARFGDPRYDIAKLAHSVLGKYDKIILGRSRLARHAAHDWELRCAATPHEAEIEQIFSETLVTARGLSRSEIAAMTGLLFLSMLPLHGDDPERQSHLLAAGLTFHSRLQEAAA